MHTATSSDSRPYPSVARARRPRLPGLGTIPRSTQTSLQHNQPTSRVVRTAGALLVVLLITLSPPSAVAQLDPGVTPFGVKLGGTRYANNSQHSYRSLEDDILQRWRWEHRFDGAGGQDVYNPTDMNLARAPDYALFPDFYWLVETLHGATAGTYNCATPLSDSVCSSARIVIADDAHQLSDLLQNNLVCHEVGHSIGFGHGTAGDSCMSGGDNNQLSHIEVGLINNYY